MKPRYKLETFVEYTEDAVTQTGVIEAQIIKADSISYFMKGNENGNSIPENDILNAYRPIVARKAKPAKKVAAPKKDKKTSNTTETQVQQ